MSPDEFQIVTGPILFLFGVFGVWKYFGPQKREWPHSASPVWGFLGLMALVAGAGTTAAGVHAVFWI